MTSDTQVYNDIYDIVKDNMEAAGKRIPNTKEAFLLSTRQDLKNIDIFEMLKLDNESFIQSLYVTLLNRTIDDAARANFGKRLDMIKADFQRETLQHLISSREYIQNNKNLKNNIYSLPSEQFSINISTSSDGNSYVDKLYHVYAKLPSWLRNFAKAILARIG